jgi:Holliday junction DNA helicase RuvB
MSSSTINQEIYNNVLTLLSHDTDGSMKKLLETIVEWEKNHHPPKDEYDGFSWYEVYADARTLNSLVTRRILRVVLKTNKFCCYRAFDLVALEKALADYEGTFTQEIVAEEQIPSDIFRIITGHSEKKDILFRSIRADRPVHMLLFGTVACLPYDEGVIVFDGEVESRPIGELCGRRILLPSLGSDGRLTITEGYVWKSARKEMIEINTEKGDIHASSDHIFFVLEQEKIVLRKANELQCKDLLLSLPQLKPWTGNGRVPILQKKFRVFGNAYSSKAQDFNRELQEDIPKCSNYNGRFVPKILYKVPKVHERVLGKQRVFNEAREDKRTWKKSKENENNYRMLMPQKVPNLHKQQGKTAKNILLEKLCNKISELNPWQPDKEGGRWRANRKEAEGEISQGREIQKTHATASESKKKNRSRGSKGKWQKGCEKAQGTREIRGVAFEGDSCSAKNDEAKLYLKTRGKNGKNPFNIGNTLCSEQAIEDSDRNKISRFYVGTLPENNYRSRWGMASPENPVGFNEGLCISRNGLHSSAILSLRGSEVPFDSEEVYRRILEGELSTIQVMEIREWKIEDAFDITVPETNNFILTNGLIVHNSAKTLFLEELARLPHSRFILGSSLTRAGLLDVLFNERPRYLIIDELEKIDDVENLSALLSLMHKGYVTETKFRRHRTVRLKTWVFASANTILNLPKELLSRFLLLRFRDYTDDEFREVTVDVLREQEGVPESLGIYIAEKVLRELSSRDVRDPCKIARLLKEKTAKEVDNLIEILKRQK